MNKVDEALLSMYVWMRASLGSFIDDFKREERGASDMVTVVILVVVVIAVATVFRNGLIGVANNAMNKVNTFIGN